MQQWAFTTSFNNFTVCIETYVSTLEVVEKIANTFEKYLAGQSINGLLIEYQPLPLKQSLLPYGEFQDRIQDLNKHTVRKTLKHEH